ncbi:MAG: Fe(3+) ABC transporter substrate-binding protein [Rhodospirillales bacterium]|nr:Fe(3+) ABC transporter substrate-binding protein [Rhodospirillales bacterium]
MRPISRRNLLRGAAAVSTFAIVSNRADAQAAGGVVNLYSARHYDTDEAIYTNFTKATGIRVNRVEAEADKLVERMRAEGANSPADLFVTVDAGRIWRAHEAGLLQPVRSATLEAAIPAQFREPGGHWFGLSKRARAIFYDKSKLKPADVPTYASLADPKWKGKIAIRSSTNVYNQSLVGAMIAHQGEAKTEEWARGLVANLARPPRGGDTDQIKAIAAGEAELAVANHYYYANLSRSKNPADLAVVEKVGISFPDQGAGQRGTHVNIAGAGIAKNAPNRANAVRFLEYLVSAEAQSVFAEGNNEFPIVVGTKMTPIIAAWGEFREDDLNAAVFGRNNEAALKLTDRAGWR